MALDHGELNVPRRTSTINRDLDRFKAEQQAERRAAAKAQRDLRTLAKAAVASMTEARVAELAVALKVKPAAVRQQMARCAHWTPELCLKALTNDARRA